MSLYEFADDLMTTYNSIVLDKPGGKHKCATPVHLCMDKHQLKLAVACGLTEETVSRTIKPSFDKKLRIDNITQIPKTPEGKDKGFTETDPSWKKINPESRLHNPDKYCTNDCALAPKTPFSGMINRELSNVMDIIYACALCNEANKTDVDYDTLFAWMYMGNLRKKWNEYDKNPVNIYDLRLQYSISGKTTASEWVGHATDICINDYSSFKQIFLCNDYKNNPIYMACRRFYDLIPSHSTSEAHLFEIKLQTGNLKKYYKENNTSGSKLKIAAREWQKTFHMFTALINNVCVRNRISNPRKSILQGISKGTNPDNKDDYKNYAERFEETVRILKKRGFLA